MIVLKILKQKIVLDYLGGTNVAIRRVRVRKKTHPRKQRSVMRRSAGSKGGRGCEPRKQGPPREAGKGKKI